MGIELGIIFAFCAMFCWGIGDFMIQKNVRKEGNVEALLFIGLIGLVGLLPFVWKDIPSLLYAPNLLLISGLGILTFFAAIFDFESLKEGKISVVEIIFEIELLVTILLGIFIFKERLNVLQWITISLVFLGIILMAVKSYHLKNPKKFLEKGAIIGLIGSIFMGSVNFLTASSARTMSPIMAVWGPALIFSLLCLFLVWQREGFVKMKDNLLKYKYIILTMGIFDTLAWTFYAFATSSREVSIITAITESYPAICVFLGLWINKERVRTHQYFGAALALVASFILGFVL